MSLEHLRELWGTLNERNFFEYLRGVQELFKTDSHLREFCYYIDTLRQKISIINRTSDDKANKLQFIMNETGKEALAFWIEFDPNWEVFDVHDGVDPNPYVTFELRGREAIQAFYHGAIYLLKEILDEDDQRISIKFAIPATFYTKKLCIDILLSFAGTLECFARYFWSAKRV